MSISEPEGDGDGYLEGEWLDELEVVKMDAKSAAHFLVNVFPRAVACLSCASIDIKDSVTILGKPAKHIKFSTGGWSGAEELIDIMLKKFWVKYYHDSWKRGGHYEFHVQGSMLEGSAS